MQWIKVLHLVFVVSWFSGLFYLPRLFVNHALVNDSATQKRLCLMEKKLYQFMSILAILALGLGVYLVYLGDFRGGWLHAKLGLVLVLIIYHLYCGYLVREFAYERNRHSHLWYRWFNEIPVVLLVLIVYLVIVKPF